MDWCAAIGDRDIAQHYRQAFRERLDDAFFAPRQQKPRSPQARTTGQRGPRGANGYTPPERAPTLRLREVQSAVDRSLWQAIIGGLLRYPERIAAHAETLATLPWPDAEMHGLAHAMIDAALLNTGLDRGGLLAILEPSDWYNYTQKVLRANGTQFSFTRDQIRLRGNADAAQGSRAMDDGGQSQNELRHRALRDLDWMIAAVSALPELERALEDANRHAMEDVSEATQSRQQACREAHQQRLQQIMDFAAESGAASGML
jgi:DNA primase